MQGRVDWSRATRASSSSSVVSEPDSPQSVSALSRSHGRASAEGSLSPERRIQDDGRPLGKGQSSAASACWLHRGQRCNCHAAEFVFPDPAAQKRASDFVFPEGPCQKDTEAQGRRSKRKEEAADGKRKHPSKDNLWSSASSAVNAMVMVKGTVAATASTAATSMVSTAAAATTAAGSVAAVAANRVQEGFSHIARKSSNGVGLGASAGRDAVAASQEQVCVICLDEVSKLVILGPCGHKAICPSCARRLLPECFPGKVNLYRPPSSQEDRELPGLGACPVCKAKITCVIEKVFTC